MNDDKVQDHIESTTVKKSDKDGWVEAKRKSKSKKKSTTSQVILNKLRSDIKFINMWKDRFGKAKGNFMEYTWNHTKSMVAKNNTLILEVKSEELKEREVKEFEVLVAEFEQLKKELGLK